MLTAAECDHISNVPFTKESYLKTTGYCYLSVILTFSPAQSDHIKWPLLYNNLILLDIADLKENR